jgi:hypothetical protein
MDCERRCIAKLGGDHRVDTIVDLAFLRIGAGRRDAIATLRRRRTADEMIAFVGGDDEERVAFGDPVLGEAREELAEGLVVGGERVDIAGLARPEGRHLVGIDTGKRLLVVVVGVLDIAGDDRDAGLEHRCQITAS